MLTVFEVWWGCVSICVPLFFHAPALRDPSQPGFPEKHVGESRTELHCQQLILESLPWSWPLGRSWPWGLSGLEKLRNRRIKDIATRVEPATKFFLTAHTVVNHWVHIVFAKGSPVCGFGAPLG